MFTCRKKSLKTKLVAVDAAGGDVTVPRGDLRGDISLCRPSSEVYRDFGFPYK